MAEGVQDIGTQTIDGYDLVIHGNLVFQGEVGRRLCRKFSARVS
jgi:hypothetical protein